MPEITTTPDIIAAHRARRDIASHAPSPLYTGVQNWLDVAPLGLSSVRIETVDDPACFYANWTHPLEGHKTVTASQLAFLQQFIAPGDLVIDVGAHAGDTAVPLGLAAGPGGLCLAFEPNLPAYRVLCVNAWLNQLAATIVPLPYAIMPQTGKMTFHYSDPGQCNGGYAEGLTAGVGVCGHAHPVEVFCVELAGVLQNVTSASLPRFSFLKLDTEGMDAALLAANTDLIRAWRPAVQTERFPGLDAAERRDWYETIVDGLGYQPFLYDDMLDFFGSPYDSRHWRAMTRDDALAGESVIDAICLPRTEE